MKLTPWLEVPFHFIVLPLTTSVVQNASPGGRGVENLTKYKKSIAVSNIQHIFATIIKERKAIRKQKTRKYKFIL